MKRVLAVLLASLAMAQVGQAGTFLNVEFGPTGINYSGVGAAPDSGTTWNHAAVFDYPTPSTLNATNLVYSDNSAATGISITSSTSITSFSDGFSNPDNGLTESRIFSAAQGAFSLIISGLDPTKTYNLGLYGSNTRYATLYTVGSQSDYALGEEGDSAPFTYHTNYAMLTHLSAGSGSITIDLSTYGTGTVPVISALQLKTETTAVPEPATLAAAMVGIAGIALVGRKRKM